MAFTKTQLEALKNALLAPNQPITATIHREFAQKIIDELYDAQSRANLLSAIQNDSSLLTTDSVFVIRNGQGFLIPSSQVGGTGSLANLTDTVIIDPQDGEVIIYNSVTEKWENRVAGVVFNDFYVRHDIDNQGLDATQKSNATTNIGAQSILEKGQIDGYASLDGTGRVPASQLPSFVDDVLEFADLASFPVTGESGKIYIALDTNKTYRWGSTTYVEISAGVVLGETESTAYRGDRGKIAYDYSQIGHLPLTGGTLASSGSTNTLDINHLSGSGLALNITKAGNGEGLKVVKTSGSGLAASITGGATLLDELNLTTKLADAHIASADTWNAKIGGTIATGQVAFGTAAGVIGGDSGLFWNNVNKRLGVGTSTPVVQLESVKPFNGFECQIQARNSYSGGGSFGGIGFGVSVSTFVNNTGYIGVLRSVTPQLIFGVAETVTNGNLTHERMRINGSTGNLLLNTTTDAGFKLDVNGTARIVGATRIDNLAGTGTRMVVADSNGVMSTQALGIAGSGTLNRLAKFTASGTVGDSQVFDDGTNVGIGTDSPSLLFSVLNKVGVDNDGRLFWGSDFSGNNRGLLTWDSNSARIQSGSTSTSLDFAIGTGDIRMRLSTNNNLLINTTADAGFKLDVNGSLRANTRVNFASLPTSSSGLVSGDLWINGTVINIIP
jgi:hypothetical protein